MEKDVLAIQAYLCPVSGKLDQSGPMTHLSHMKSISILFLDLNTDLSPLEHCSLEVCQCPYLLLNDPVQSSMMMLANTHSLYFIDFIDMQQRNSTTDIILIIRAYNGPLELSHDPSLIKCCLKENSYGHSP